MKNILITLILIITFISCDDSSVNGGNPNSTNNFPNREGTTWRYQVTDSLTSIVDTVNIFVKGKTNLSSGEQVTIWEMVFNDKTDSNYILIKNDTVKIFQDLEYLVENIKLVFPLQQGNKWTGDFVSDSFFVSGVTQMSVPAGEFNNVFIIERRYGGFNEYKRMTIWFVKDIGIIKLHQQDIGLVFENEMRELLSYNIN